MRLSIVIITIGVVVVSMIIGCKFQVSEEKKLREVHGSDMGEEELKKTKELAKKQAKMIISGNCGSALSDINWVETADNGDGFFMSKVKDKNKMLAKNKTHCETQYLSIDVQAAHYMGQHSISCEIDVDKKFSINIPGKGDASNAVKALCDTRLVDLSYNAGTVRIATVEEDGSTYTAHLNAQGEMDGSIKRAIQGVSATKLLEIKNRIQNFAEDSDRRVTFTGTTTGLAIAGAAGHSIAMEAAAVTGVAAGKTVAAFKTTTVIIAGGIMAKIAIPVTTAILVGTLIWKKHKGKKVDKDAVLGMREMVRVALSES